MKLIYPFHIFSPILFKIKELFPASVTLSFLIALGIVLLMMTFMPQFSMWLPNMLM